MSESEHASIESQMVGKLTLDQPAMYRICVQGELEDDGSDRLGGMQISQQVKKDHAVITVLDGRLINQASLFGVLMAIYNMRLPLISIECLETAAQEDDSILTVNIKQHADYIEFIVTGTFDLDHAINKFPLVIVACRQTGIAKALIDYRLLGGEKMITQELLYAHRAGEFYQEHLSTGGQPLKIAFVSNQTPSLGISEAIGRTYGLDGIVTSHYQEAIDWLFAENLEEKII